MFCRFCGKELDDNAAFCSGCGAQMQEDTPVYGETTVLSDMFSPQEQPVAQVYSDETTLLQEQPVVQVYTGETTLLQEQEAPTSNFSGYTQPARDYDFAQQGMETVTPAPNKKKKGLIIGIAAGVVAVALIIVGVLVIPNLLSNNYKDVAKKYAVAFVQQDAIEASKCSLINFEQYYENQIDEYCEWSDVSREEAFEELSEEYEMKIDSVDDILKADKAEALAELEEEFGKYTISTKIVEAEKMDAEDLSDVKDYIDENDYYYSGVNSDKIKEGYFVEVEVTITGSEDTDTDTLEITVVKYGNKWKACDY